MATRARPAAKRGRVASKFPKVASGELRTLLDFVRYAASRFIEAKLVFAHGTTDPVAEAVFLVCETLHLHPDQFETFATARVTAAEAKQIVDLIARRIATRHEHFMPRSLLHSQFEALEEPGSDEDPIIVSIEPGPREIVAQILSARRHRDERTA